MTVPSLQGRQPGSVFILEAIPSLPWHLPRGSLRPGESRGAQQADFVNLPWEPRWAALSVLLGTLQHCVQMPAPAVRPLSPPRHRPVLC